MACFGCQPTTFLQLGWMPVDGNGDPAGGGGSQLLVPWPLPTPTQTPTLGASTMTPMTYAQGYPRLPYNIAGGVSSLFNANGDGDFEFSSSSQANFNDLRFKAIGPGAGESETNGDGGECVEEGSGCAEEDPCVGSIKYRIEITDGEVDQAHYTRTCVGGGGEDPVDPEGDPADYGSAEPAEAGTGSSSQRPVGYDNGNKSKVAIEVPFSACGCTNMVSVTIKDKNGNAVEVEDQATNQKFVFVITIIGHCTLCNPQYSTEGACCFTVEHETYCQEVANQGACDALVETWEGEFIAFYEGDTCEESECEGEEPPEQPH